jgi:hypothetical protein
MIRWLIKPSNENLSKYTFEGFVALRKARVSFAIADTLFGRQS